MRNIQIITSVFIGILIGGLLAKLYLNSKNNREIIKKRVYYYLAISKEQREYSILFYNKATHMDTTIVGWRNEMYDYVDSAKKYNILAMETMSKAKVSNDSLIY